MDRPQRRNPSIRSHSSSMKPPRPPRGPTVQAPPASRPLPEPSSPDGRQRKKVRFATEANGHHISGGQVPNMRDALKSKPQVCDAKTAEYKFFKKLCEQSGHMSHSYNHSHLSSKARISKQKHESHNVNPLRKFPVQRNSMCCDDPPATPPKNEEIPDEKVDLQSSPFEYEHKDAPEFNPHDCLQSVHVLTPMAQTSFEVTGISRNIDRELVSGKIFSEKRSKLLKLAAKTVSMGSEELLQRRSEFLGNILQRLGTNNITRKQQEGSMRHKQNDCRQAPAITEGHSDKLLDCKRTDFNSLTKLTRTGKSLSSYANVSDEACEFMAYKRACQGLPSFVDRKNDLPCGSIEARDFMLLPWVCIKDISSSDQRRAFVHNQVSNLLLEDVEPDVNRRSASADELSFNVQTTSYDQHGRGPRFSVTLAESFRDRLSFPCQIEEQHRTLPYAVSNTSWQPDLHSSIEHRVRLEKEDPNEAGFFGNFDAGFSTRLDQSVAKPIISGILDSGNDILDHCDFRYISNFHVNQSNKMVFAANTNCLNSMFSTPDQPYEVGAKRLLDSAVDVPCLAGLEEKYSSEVQLSSNPDKLLRVLDQLPIKFTTSSFSNDESKIWGHHHLRYITSCPPEDNSSILSLDANDSVLNSLSSCAEHPCKQDWNSLIDSSTELWSSMHQFQSHASLEAVLGFMSNGSAYSDVGHHSLTLLQGNLNSGLDTTDLPFLGSCSALDNVTDIPMSRSDGITW